VIGMSTTSSFYCVERYCGDGVTEPFDAGKMLI
jgi:hypothetical protein